MDIEERLKKLEVECFTNTQYQQMGTHVSLRILGALMQSGTVDGDLMRSTIVQTFDELQNIAAKSGGDGEVKTFEAYKVFLLGQLPNCEKPKEFLLSGGVS